MNIQRINYILMQINKIEQRLQISHNERIDNYINGKILKEIIDISKNNILFERLIGRKNIVDGKPDQITFLSKYGILVDYKDNSIRKDLSKFITINDIELWLLNDGTFLKTNKTSRSHIYKSWWGWNRRIIGTIDIIEVIEKWNIDYIIKSIKDNLEKQIVKLNKKNMPQKFNKNNIRVE